MGADLRVAYLDNAATSPCDPRVVDAMLPWLCAEFGNPSSLHLAGRRARAAVDQARGQVAALIGAEPDEIVFTASGTEADNLALRGAATRNGVVGGHLVASAIEHPAVLETCRALATSGASWSALPVDTDGIACVAELDGVLASGTRVVSVMAANNVVGTLQPIGALAARAQAAGALFHTDAVQAAGKVPLDVRETPVDLLSLSAHKLHGPKGIGALYVRRGIGLEPIVHGGGQEGGLRSATENVAAIVGFGVAAELAAAERTAEAARLVGLREMLIDGVLAEVPGAYVVGDRFRRLPGHACFGFAGYEGEAIRVLLDLDARGIAVSSGSACSAHHAAQPSHVLTAMGFDPIRARGSLRVTLGRFNDADDVVRLLEVLPQVLAGARPILTRGAATETTR